MIKLQFKLPQALISRGFTRRTVFHIWRQNKSKPAKIQFPKEFSLSVNPKHYNNQSESIKFIEIKKLNFPNQRALAIFDVFRGQVTQPVLDLFEGHNIAITFVPANMTHLYQPLDLTVNGYAKQFCKRKFNQWYTDQITQQLDDGKTVQEIDVKLRLTTLKPLHAQWMTEFLTTWLVVRGKKLS